MKHYLIGVLFFLIFFTPKICFATIDLTISNLASKDYYFEVSALVTGMSSSSATFIQGMFTKADTPKYFGFTLSKKGEWLSYDGSPEKSFVLENFVELKNDSSQKIFLKPDYEDSDYQGAGKYVLKLKRYTASGSPSDYSNSLELDLNYSSPTPTPSPSETAPPITLTPIFTNTITQPNSVTPPTKTPTPKTSSPTPSSSKAPTLILPQAATGSPTIAPLSVATLSQVLSLTTESGKIASTPEIISPSSSVSDKNLFLVGVSVFSISGGLLYFRLKNL